LDWAEIAILMFGNQTYMLQSWNVTHRVHRLDFHVIDRQTVKNFMVENFINETDPLSKTGVSFKTGLYSYHQRQTFVANI